MPGRINRVLSAILQKDWGYLLINSNQRRYLPCMRSTIQKLAFTAAACLLAIQLAAQKKVCITIDDVPVVDYGMNTVEDWQNITDKLLTTCEQKGIPAIGYVNEGKFHKNGNLDAERAKILEVWLERGFELGNHTFSHPNYHKVGLKDFKRDVIDGERYTKPLLQKYGQELKYFRHPYLRAGDSKESSEALEAFLTERGYTSSPVTLDSDDYLFAQAYARAARSGDSTRMKLIGETYVQHTEKKLHFYETLSEAVFERNIDHTYLMHANLLNADYLDELAEMFQRNGYEFISQAEVLKDPAYSEPMTRFGNWGMSWLYRWALSRDKGTEVFKQDVELPEIVR